jgi:hypothetical protein
MQPQREIPPTELSLKFMAWDVKKGTEALNKLVDAQATTSVALADIANSLKLMVSLMRAKPSSPSSEVPF